jgi:RimJ/RimL family protein N-acetyltransferase
MIDRQPVLTGETVQPRPVTAEDWPALFAVASDPELWALHPARDRWREEIYRAQFEEGLASGGMLVILDRSTGAVIGSSRFDNHRPELDRVEIGWTFLARSHWGGATNLEVKRLMIDHALRHVSVVVFRVAETNLRSRRALEKIGAVLSAETDDALVAGRPVRHVVYTLHHVPTEERTRPPE